MKKTIQEVMEQLNQKLTDAISGYREGLVCPRESLNYLIDAVCQANADAAVGVTCDQTWKPCLLDERVVCNCKTLALPTDIVGRCNKCKRDIPASDKENVVDHGIEVSHKECPPMTRREKQADLDITSAKCHKKYGDPRSFDAPAKTSAHYWWNLVNVAIDGNQEAIRITHQDGFSECPADIFHYHCLMMDLDI